MTIEWDAYRKCPVCFAPIGEPCASITVGFVTEAPRVAPRDRPHSSRELRTGAVIR